MLYKLIERAGMEPAGFEWFLDKTSYADEAHTLKCKNSSYFFAFLYFDGNWNAIYSPGNNITHVNVGKCIWNEMLSQFVTWLSNLEREDRSEDPWELLGKYKPEGVDDFLLAGENKFTYDEVESLSRMLSGLKKSIIKEFSLDGDKVTLVNNKLDVLLEKAKKFDRIDWKNLFVGNLMGIAMALALNPEQSNRLWYLAKECFRSVKLLAGA